MTNPIDDPLASFSPGLFAGKTAIVTGGGRGIGAATARGDPLNWPACTLDDLIDDVTGRFS